MCEENNCEDKKIYSAINKYGLNRVIDSVFNRFTRLDVDDYGNEYENVYTNTYAPLYEPFSTNNKIPYLIIIFIIIYLFTQL